jgi:hypothetical protein
LENANLTLRGQVATLENSAAKAQKDVATLQTAAADAKAAQQKVETELQKQKERTATAEYRLLELQERIKDRRISGAQYAHLLALLKPVRPKEPTFVASVRFDAEGREFAKDINKVMLEAEWTSAGAEAFIQTPAREDSGEFPVGLILMIHDHNAVPNHATVLFNALIAVGLHPTWGEMDAVPPSRVQVLVGRKPLN